MTRRFAPCVALVLFGPACLAFQGTMEAPQRTPSAADHGFDAAAAGARARQAAVGLDATFRMRFHPKPTDGADCLADFSAQFRYARCGATQRVEATYADVPPSLRMYGLIDQTIVDDGTTQMQNFRASKQVLVTPSEALRIFPWPGTLIFPYEVNTRLAQGVTPDEVIATEHRYTLSWKRGDDSPLVAVVDSSLDWSVVEWRDGGVACEIAYERDTQGRAYPSRARLSADAGCGAVFGVIELQTTSYSFQPPEPDALRLQFDRGMLVTDGHGLLAARTGAAPGEAASWLVGEAGEFVRMPVVSRPMAVNGETRAAVGGLGAALVAGVIGLRWRYQRRHTARA